jgi:FMN hydrolase / 5-amino-6-(5-phospho-D-ribitylamino)uracil phosphatase
VEAVTFDFWNTLMWEEPGSLREKRLQVWAETLGPEADLERAHDAAHQEYVDSWTAGRQFRVEEAVDHMLERLDSELGPDAAAALMDGFSEGGRRAAVHPSDGVRECLEQFRSAGMRLGIVCDIGLTPSQVVRELLDRHELLAYFDGMSFSDEVGHYKPHRAIFEHALAGLGGIPPDRAAHVGDRRRTDVAGAAAMGMTSVRYNGVYEDEAIPAPEADIVLGDLSELPPKLGVTERVR